MWIWSKLTRKTPDAQGRYITRKIYQKQFLEKREWVRANYCQHCLDKCLVSNDWISGLNHGVSPASFSWLLIFQKVISINPFQANVTFLYPLTYSQTTLKNFCIYSSSRQSNVQSLKNKIIYQLAGYGQS